MGFKRLLKIEIQRWIFRVKQKHAESIDFRRHQRAIRKADRASQRMNKRLWVFREGPGRYHIYTKPQVKAAARIFREFRTADINIYHTNQYIIHITKKPQ